MLIETRIAGWIVGVGPDLSVARFVPGPNRERLLLRERIQP